VRTMATIAAGVGLGAVFYSFAQAKDSPDARLQRFRQEFELSPNQLTEIGASYSGEIEKRLRGEDGTLMFLHSCVDKLPTGTETGVIYALDLGGSNYRVVRVELKGHGTQPIISQTAEPVPQSLMSDEADATMLFDWLAAKIVEFAKINGDTNNHIPIGFTFSFGVKQSRLDEGILVMWTKGYATRGVVGENVVDLMQKACERANLNVRIHACVNDTVGTLMSCAYENADCYMGVIIGTGFNGCYVEPRWDGEIVNVEWGGFNDMPITHVDMAIDKITLNAGAQLLEKQVSGKYLGEIVRRIFNIVFENSFIEPWKFETKHVSFVLDAACNHEKTKLVVSELNFQGGEWTPEHSRILREICIMVRARSAALATIVISESVKKTRRLESNGTISVGVDGSVFKLMPGYKDEMKSILGSQLGDAASRVRLVLSEDGSGKGAAVLVAPLVT